MIDDLLKLMDASADKARPNATAKAALQTKLTALAIDPLLVTLPLDAARALMSGRHEETLRALLGKMTLAQMKKASKTWNPNRKAIPKDMGLADLRRELRELLERKAEPVPVLPKFETLMLPEAHGYWEGSLQREFKAELAGWELPKLKAASKKWNPNRGPIATDISKETLRKELRDLLDRKVEPVEKTAKAPAARRKTAAKR